MLKSALVLLVAGLSATAFAWDKFEGVGKAEQKGVITVKPTWVKDKDQKFDIEMGFTNQHDKSILLFVGDMKCGRGADQAGQVSPDRVAERIVDLRPGESRNVILICKLNNKEKGDFTMSMKVFENPSGDTRTPGKVLAEKLVWKQGQNEGKVL